MENDVFKWGKDMCMLHNIEYVGYEDNFEKFLEMLEMKLRKENRMVKLWCNLEFLPKIKKYDRVIPIYYKKYGRSIVSIKRSLKKGEFFKVLCEVINRLTHRNYMRYIDLKNDILPCCLINLNGQVEVIEDVKETDFKGNDNTLVLRRYESASGMFSHILILLPYIKWAKDNGLEIYFDMSRGDSIYREKDGDNAWEYFYHQTGVKPNPNNGTLISQMFKISDKYKFSYDPGDIDVLIKTGEE